MATSKKPTDFMQRAKMITDIATGQIENPNPSETKIKNPHAVALGRLGGLKGGKVRANNLTPERRKEIGKNAINKRWEKE
jgi:hypothetical protein